MTSAPITATISLHYLKETFDWWSRLKQPDPGGFSSKDGFMPKSALAAGRPELRAVRFRCDDPRAILYAPARPCPQPIPATAAGVRPIQSQNDLVAVSNGFPTSSESMAIRFIRKSMPKVRPYRSLGTYSHPHQTDFHIRRIVISKCFRRWSSLAATRLSTSVDGLSVPVRYHRLVTSTRTADGAICSLIIPPDLSCQSISRVRGSSQIISSNYCIRRAGM